MQTEKIIHIPQGSISKIITQLNEYDEGFSPNIDKHLLKLFGYPQSGWIDMKTKKLSKADFFYNISHAKAALTSITLIPGETSYLFLQQLSQELDLSFNTLQDAYKKYAPYEDGWIIADTYHIPVGISEEDLIKHLINQSTNTHKNLSNNLLEAYQEEQWLRFLTIASIIQKEAANIDEMPIVSSVIYNRLEKNMKLQMDGTLNYGKYSHVKITPKMIREDTSRYNTYMYNNIPPNPVCAVSRDAIKAAIFPANTRYLYFVKKDGANEHVFTSTYKEHLNKINSK